jgi:hypothetical protein
MRSKSEVVGTLRSVPQFLESIKNQASALDLMFGWEEHVTWPAWLPKAWGARVLAALKRDGWVATRGRGRIVSW